MAIQNNFPAIRPTLLLDFANTGRLDPRITFTRASSATFFDSAGVLQTAASGAARFTYDPATLQPQGLLIEEQRTNLTLYSEELDNAAWTKSNSTITANAVVSPDSTVDADKLVEDTANSTHAIDQILSFTSGTSYTVSVYVKAAERPTVQLVLYGTAFNESRTWFNLATGVATTTTGAVTSAFVINVGNGWYRVGVTQSATATSTGSLSFRIWNGTTALYTGDGTSGIFLWGAQLEAGAFPTSYIPTTTTAFTRNADAASMTGTNFSSWYNAAEGTFYVDWVRDTTSGAVGGGGNSVPRIFATGTSGTGVQQLRLFGSTGAEVTGPSTYMASTWAVNQQNKHAIAYKVDDNAVVRNGGAAVTDTTSTAVTGVDMLSLGQNTTGVGNSGQLYISRFAYYPTRLPNATLQALTA